MLVNKRVVITQADRFMGPVLTQMFRAEKADVIEDYRDLTHPFSADNLAKEAGNIDILIINLAAPRSYTPATEISDEESKHLFNEMVFPLMRLGRAFLPAMQERRHGKIVLIGSAAGLKGFANVSAYAAARGAQLSWVRATGIEVAPFNIHLTAIAQIFIENAEYFSQEYQLTDEFKDRLKNVPAGRLGTPEECAALVKFLADEQCNFLPGQIIPLTGGWLS